VASLATTRCRLSTLEDQMFAKISRLMILTLAGFATAATAAEPTKEQQRAAIRKESDQILAMLYKAHPAAREKVAKAPGYATFNAGGVTVLFIGGTGGEGVAIDNATKHATYMKAAQISVGLGLGFKDQSLVMIFKNKKAFDQFVNKGWEFGGQGSAAAKVDKTGGAKAGSIDYGDFEVYQLTKNGLMAEVTVTGTKYSKDAELN
jgi:lipid-binding SYLF domain-containing protein